MFHWIGKHTNLGPINGANVKISYFTDGGNNFSTLVASTANDGSEVVTIPNTLSSTARIKIEAVGNIFFDISNSNFTISGAAACGDPAGLTSSAITNTSATVSWSAVSGALTYDVDYKAASSGIWINAATATSSTTVNLSGLVLGTTYDWRVIATCAGGNGNYVQAQFTTTAPCNTPTGLTSSAVTASSATVSWSAVSGAVSYDVDYKLASSGTWINSITGTTSTSRSITGLTASSLYDWRVRTNCASGSSAYGQAQFTTLVASACPGIYDVSTNGSRGGAATIPFNTDIKGLINVNGDVDYYKFVITTGGTITVSLTGLPADYDLRLYRNNTNVASSSNAGITNETINYTATANTYYARVVGFNGAFNASSCYTLKVQLGTASRGEELITAGNLTAFPNPVNDKVNLKINDLQGNATIRVFDMYGRMMMQQNSTQSLTQLDVSKLSSGLYMIRVLNGGKESTLKIVKE